MVVNPPTGIHIEAMANRDVHPDDIELAHKLSERLRQLRKTSGLTQEDVAERASIAAFTYQKYEKGESKPGTPMNPQLFTLHAIAKAFEINVAQLLTFDDEVPSRPSGRDA